MQLPRHDHQVGKAQHLRSWQQGDALLFLSYVNTFGVRPDNREAVAGLYAKATLSLCRDKCFALALR